MRNPRHSLRARRARNAGLAAFAANGMALISVVLLIVALTTLAGALAIERQCAHGQVRLCD